MILGDSADEILWVSENNLEEAYSQKCPRKPQKEPHLKYSEKILRQCLFFAVYNFKLNFA